MTFLIRADSFASHFCSCASCQQIGHSKIFLRRELADKLERLVKLRVHCAARTIGRFGRQVAYSRVSMLLVAWVRFRLKMRKKYRAQRAATKIVATVRRYKQIRVYALTRQAIILIQSQQRQMLAKKRVRKIKDPFIEMTFRQCQRLVKDEQARLEKAVKAKDFRLAAKLEARV